MTGWDLLWFICGWVGFFIIVLAAAWVVIGTGMFVSGFIISAGRHNKRNRG